jgi:hypothetical protein
VTYKLTCPGCDRYTSAIFRAYEDGYPCPYCGSSLRAASSQFYRQLPEPNIRDKHMSPPIDPVVELVLNAMGFGVMMALEGKPDLLKRLSALPADGSLADALRSDAEGFVKTRSDLVEALSDQMKG